jgi:hypothetical protein
MGHKPKEPDQAHLDDLLDAALAGTFPASDPVAHLVSEAKKPPLPAAGAKGGPPRDKGEEQSH